MQKAGEGVLWRALQLAGVQGVYFIRLLVLAKLLAPEAFGLLAIAMVAVTTAMRLSDVGMIPALVQKQDATREQYDGAWTVGLLRSSLVAVVLFIAAPAIASLFEEPLATPLIQALALRPLIDASASIGVARLTREMRFKPLALMYFTGALVDLLVAVSTARSLGVWALVAGALAGSATTMLLSYRLAPHRPSWSFRWKEIRPLANFGRWVLLVGITGLVGELLVQLAISRQLGAAALGLYFLALRLAFLPSNVASAVIVPVAMPVFARLQDDPGAATKVFAEMLGALCLLLLPVYAIMFSVALLFEQALGSNWTGTARLIQVLCVAGAAGILKEFLIPLLMGHGRSDLAFRLELVQTILLLAVLLPALSWFGVVGAAAAWLVANLAATLLAAWIARGFVPGAFVQAARRVAAAGAAAVLAGGTAAVLASRAYGLTGLLIVGTAGVSAAGAVLWMLNSRAGLDLEGLLAVITRRRAA